MTDEKYRRMIAILIAVVTVFAALIAQLQAEAGDRDDRANRDAKRASVEAFGIQVRGSARANYDYYSAYEQYRELDELRRAAEREGEDKDASRYEDIASRLLDTSPLLSGKDPAGKAYFDPEGEDEPDIDRFEAYTYVKDVEERMQQFQAASVVKDAWDGKANTYIVHLTLLAVSVFLFGLAGTVATRATRGIFTAGGCLITVVAVGWAVATWAAPVLDLRDQGSAIPHYAMGVALAYMGHDKEAIPEFDAAVADYPEYTVAYLERGRAYMGLDEPDLARALESFLRARQLDPGNDQVLLEIGWCQYQLGQFTEAVASCRQGLAARPDDLSTRFVLGISLLASGKAEEAKAEYQKGLDQAAAEVAELNKGREPGPGAVLAPSEILAALEEGADDLDSLDNAIDEEEGPPPVDKVQDPEQVQKDCEEISSRLVSWELALENTGLPPTGKLTGKLEELTFQDISEDKPVDPDDDDTFHGDIAQIQLSFAYSGMKDGQVVTYRFFQDGEELDSWRWTEKWTGGGEGEWEEPIYPEYSDTFHFESGDYLVEIFVDYQLAAYGNFTVAEEDE